MSSSRQMFLFIVLLGILIVCFLVIFITSYNVERGASGAGALLTKDGGVIYDLNSLFLKSNVKTNETKLIFEVKGFKYSSLPSKLKKYKFLRNIPQMWVLEDVGSIGTIEIRDLQPISKFKHKEPKSVTVIVTYYLSWDHGQAGIAVSGINTDPITKNREEQVETLSVLSVGESIQPTFCKKIIFLGPVEQVKVEAFIGKKDNYVLISEVKVALGTDKYDNDDEVTCK